MDIKRTRRSPDEIASEHQRKANSARARAKRIRKAQDFRRMELLRLGFHKLVKENDPQAIRVLKQIKASIEDAEDRSLLGLEPFNVEQARIFALDRAIQSYIAEYLDADSDGKPTAHIKENFVNAVLKWESRTGKLFLKGSERHANGLPEIEF